MKVIKTIFAAMMVCAATALIAMAGMFPAAIRQNDPAEVQAQTTTELPEIVPAIALDSITIDSIFR
jgi:hypothetical protein